MLRELPFEIFGSGDLYRGHNGHKPAQISLVVCTSLVLGPSLCSLVIPLQKVVIPAAAGAGGRVRLYRRGAEFVRS